MDLQKYQIALNYYAMVLECLLRSTIINKDSSKPKVEIDIGTHVYYRYMYLIAKFFQISGYDVYITPHITTINNIRTDMYCRLLFKTKNIHLQRPKKPSLLLTDNQSRFNKHSKGPKKLITPAYFSKQQKNRQHIVPMSMHPNMYHFDYWNTNLDDNGPRQNSAILFGNFDSNIYKRIGDEGVFRSSDRIAIVENLTTFSKIVFVTSLEDLKCQDYTGSVVVVDSNKKSIPAGELRSILSRFRYHISVPGAFMPLCHNIIEALSSGCVPIVEYEYAGIMTPCLENNVTALCYEGASEIAGRVADAFAKPEIEWREISQRASRFYEGYFTPPAVVRDILNSPFDLLAIQSGQYAVELLKAEHTSLHNPSKDLCDL